MDVILPLRPLLQVWWLLKTARSTPLCKEARGPPLLSGGAISSPWQQWPACSLREGALP